MAQPPRREARSGRQQLDDTSKAIIEQLQQDGRRAYATIGKAVGLSEAAVRQRVQKLIESGVVQIVAVTDPQQIGFARQVMIGINVEGNIDEIASDLAEIAELVYVVITAGSFDLLCEAVVVDDEHLLELINDRIRKLPGVRRTETFIYLKLKKQTYNWGIA
jgi:Lrp/AsnC family transcriptional regulator for asnA, asnC and gidA